MKQLRILVVVGLLLVGCHEGRPGIDEVGPVGPVDTGFKMPYIPKRAPRVQYYILSSGYPDRLEKMLNQEAEVLANSDLWYIDNIQYQFSEGAHSALITVKKR